MEELIVRNMQDKDEFVSTMVVNKQGKAFSFIRKNNQKLDPGKKDLISGHIKAGGEVPIQAMYRELREEIGIMQEDIQAFYSLGEIKLPHPKLKDKICHSYCVLIDYTKEQLEKSIQERATEKELEKVEELESLQALLEDIKNVNSNWRVYCSQELEQKINLAIELLQKNQCFEIER